MGVAEEKEALRREFLKRRAGLTGREEKDRLLFAHVTSLPQWREAKRLYLYLSAKGEPDTFRLAKAALEEGKEVLAPVCGEEEGRMEFYRFSDLSHLRPGRWGIWEPDARSCEKGISSDEDGESLCLVPGLAFDRLGHRLGYGKGYYDRFLAARELKTVGLCCEACFVERLPAESFDKRVGLVATEAGVVCAREGSTL